MFVCKSELDCLQGASESIDRVENNLHDILALLSYRTDNTVNLLIPVVCLLIICTISLLVLVFGVFNKRFYTNARRRSSVSESTELFSQELVP